MKKTIKKFQSKLQEKSGETIVETLVTMLILSLAVLMLAGAVITAARINKKADNTGTAFSVEDASITNGSSVIITDSSQTGTEDKITVPVTLYKTKNNYQYYKSK